MNRCAKSWQTPLPPAITSATRLCTVVTPTWYVKCGVNVLAHAADEGVCRRLRVHEQERTRQALPRRDRGRHTRWSRGIPRTHRQYRASATSEARRGEASGSLSRGPVRGSLGSSEGNYVTRRLNCQVVMQVGHAEIMHRVAVVIAVGNHRGRQVEIARSKSRQVCVASETGCKRTSLNDSWTGATHSVCPVRCVMRYLMRHPPPA